MDKNLLLHQKSQTWNYLEQAQKPEKIYYHITVYTYDTITITYDTIKLAMRLELLKENDGITQEHLICLRWDIKCLLSKYVDVDTITSL